MTINSYLIISSEEEDNSVTYILSKSNPKENRDTKLSDIFDQMPSGLILKEETGLGATTLELFAKRNSIIVEPIKVTASSKAFTSATPALYVGSPTKLHPKGAWESMVKKYLKDETIIYKKFLVVADSLQQLFNVIGETALSSFFLLIDEIDSFQLDSSYRTKMEDCIDIYKSFPKDKRAMVSATTLAFSDPELSGEPKTILRYDKPNRRKINIAYAPKNIQGAATQKLIDLVKSCPSDKIMVAYNSVVGCVGIANKLTANCDIKKEDIKLLCSGNSKDKAGEYYAELESDILPGKVNFVTSAYFTGFDLSERYHLISITSNLNSVHSLSDKRLKQIAGRCRDSSGLLSETILYNLLPINTPPDIETEVMLVETAQREIAALKCIERNYENHPLLKASTDIIRNVITERTSVKGFRLVRTKNKKAIISYLNIDACLEAIRVSNELYREIKKLPEVLKKDGHIVSKEKINEEIVIEKSTVEKESRNRQINEVLDLLENRDPKKNPKQLLVVRKWPHVQKDIIEKWSNLYQYIAKEKLFSLWREAAHGRDSRKLENIYLGAYFLSFDPSSHYKRQLANHIPIGRTFTAEQLLSLWNTIFTESGIFLSFKKPGQAVKYTKLHYKTTIRRGEKNKHFISKENPFDLKLLKYRNPREVIGKELDIKEELNEKKEKKTTISKEKSFEKKSTWKKLKENKFNTGSGGQLEESKEESIERKEMNTTVSEAKGLNKKSTWRKWKEQKLDTDAGQLEEANQESIEGNTTISEEKGIKKSTWKKLKEDGLNKKDSSGQLEETILDTSEMMNMLKKGK